MAVALMLTFAGSASAATTAGNWEAQSITNPSVGDPATGIVFSRHNLSSLGEHWQAHTTGAPASIQTTQICVFCHTPHHTNNTDNIGPLWNKQSNGASTYTTYTSKFPGGTNNGGSTPDLAASGVSLACLGCHDATTAIDMMINAPGKGSNTTQTASDAGFGFYDGGNYKGDKLSGRLNLQKDLSNDHPIGMTYPVAGNGTFGIFSLRGKDTPIGSVTMDNAKGSAFGRSDNMWSINGVISNTGTIAQVLKGSTGTVECGSCHDPHYKNQTNDDPGILASYGLTSGQQTHIDYDGLFLRRVGGNSNSGVCRTCHAK